MLIQKNLEQISQNIEKACAPWPQHDPCAVTVIAVSKRQPMEKIEEALAAGHRVYGENKVQEAHDHWVGHRDTYKDLKLHLIGPLQTNKAKDAVALFDVIHTVDREKLARKLADQMKEQGRDLPCFIQVNIGEEEQKSGVAIQELPAFFKYCKEDCGLNIVGLMCIPPADEPSALYYGLLKNMAEAHGLDQLSMGMSSDYEKAVALGASHIRVGSDIFGARES